VQHAIFIGEHELSIDEKGRLLVPAEIRRSIDPDRDGGAFYLVVGQNRKPWLWPQRTYEEIVSQRENDLTPDEDMLAFDQLYFAMASRVEPDKQGRILVPDKILRRTGTSKEVTLLGVRDHLELWNRSDWEGRFEQNLDRLSELALKARQARKSP
jgi:MraZ protein